MEPESLPNYKTEQQERVEEITVASEALDLPIDDADLVAIVDRKIAEDTTYYKSTLKLDTRARLMEDFYIGKQFDERNFSAWQVPYKDNIIWQDLEHRISMAAGRMPDIIVTPADGSQPKKDSARTLEKVLAIRLKNEVTKRLVKDGLRHLHLSLRCAIKCRWDKNRGPNGDFVFDLVQPTRIGVDHTATIPQDGFTSDNMELIYEWIEEPIGLVVSKFPSKKAELFAALGIVRGTARQMATKMKYLEFWFTWYGKDGKIYEGTGWKYNTLVLDKEKNPYFDWDGYETANPDVLGPDGQPQVDTLYRNHFERPRKPYIWFTHINLGKSPIDDTSAVEQSIPLQRIVNKRGRQITEISDRAIPKVAFSGRYITKEEARRVTNDPDEHIWLQNAEDIRQGVMSIPANNPNPILLQDLASNRNQIDSKFSTHATTRGEVRAHESGFSKQITREGDLVASDDIASIVVERVFYEMANWAVQMMKLNYDKPHYVKNVGKDGEMIEAELTQDSIDDGIAVNVDASSVDKQRRRTDAMNLAADKAIDPLSLMEDLDLPNPKERTKLLISFLQGQQDGYARYMQTAGLMGDGSDTTVTPGSDPNAPGGAGGAATDQPQGPDPQAQKDIQTLQQGQPVPVSGVPSPQYVQTFMQFVQGGGLDQMPPQVQQVFAQHIAELKAVVSQHVGGV